MQTDNSLWEAERLLVNRLKDNLATVAPGIPLTRVKLPNAPWPGTPNDALWLRVPTPINNGPIEQDATGCYEINSGIFVVTVFAPMGTFSQAALKIAQDIKGLYTAEYIGDIVVESVIVSPTPEPEGSPWYGVNVQVNFTFEGHTS